MKIAYLASRDTLPGADRRSDAFEHDQTVAALRNPLHQNGMELCPVQWDGSDVSWPDFGAAIVGTTWDYWDRKDQFIETMETIESQIPLLNSSKVIRWNSDKIYLQELEKAGIPMIPTTWVDNPSASDIEKQFGHFDCDKLVVKRRVSAGARGQFLFTQSDSLPEDLSGAHMIQPFQDAIKSEGEISFLYIGGEFSHALTKRPKSGDYRIQSMYGGIETAIEPSESDKQAAQAVLNCVEDELLYARVDMLRAATGELLLIELEIIEPFLYPLQGPNLGDLMAKALVEKLGR